MNGSVSRIAIFAFMFLPVARSNTIECPSADVWQSIPGHRHIRAQLCGQHDVALVPFCRFRQILFAKHHLLHAFAGHSLRFCFQRIHYLLSKVTPVRSKSRWMTGQNVTKGGAKRRERRTLEPKPRSCRRNATASWRKQACGVSKKRLFGNGIIFCVDTNL